MRGSMCFTCLFVTGCLVSCSEDVVVDDATTATGGTSAGGSGAAGATTSSGGTTSTGTATATGTGGSGGSGGVHVGGGEPGECPGGFCRPMMMSSCGDPSYDAHPMDSCTTLDGQDGYCCLPPGYDGGLGPCGGNGGYCTTMNQCQTGYVMTQMGCDIGGQFGSCCMPDPQ